MEKKTKRIIYTWIIGVVIIYFGFAFVINDIDSTYWDFEQRAFCALGWLFAGIISIIINMDY